MKPHKKSSSQKDHLPESIIASLVTTSAGVLVISEPKLLQSQNWSKIIPTALGTMFCLFLFGALGYAAVYTFYTFNPNAKKGEEEKVQSKSIVERIIFWLVFLAVTGWLMLKFAGAI